MENMVNTLEAKIEEYKAAKAEAKAEMKAKLEPIWAEVVKIQSELKVIKAEEKKKKQIQYYKDKLAELEG